MIVFFATAFLGLIVASYGRLSQSKYQSTAALLGNEGIRAVASIADRNWNALQCPVFPCTFGLRKDGNAYALTPAPDMTGSPPQTVFTRTVTIDPLWRNNDGEMVSGRTSGAIPDSDARLVTVTISWLNQIKRNVTAEFTSLVSRSHKTSSLVFDTQDDFAGKTGNPATAPQFHGTVAVRELVNGEVRTGTTGSFENPQAVQSIVELTQPSEHVIAIVRDEDRLLSMTSQALSIFSLDNISKGDVRLERRIPLSGTPTALAVSRDAIFLGKEDGSIDVIRKRENPTYGVTALWTGLGSSPIRVLTLDTNSNLLLLGKAHGRDAEFLAVNLTKDPSLSSPILAFRQQLPSSVTAIVSDGSRAFIGMESNELSIINFNAPTLASHLLAGEVQTISSLALDKDTLFVLRTSGGTEPELSSWRVVQEEDESYTSLKLIQTINLPSLTSPGKLLLLLLSGKLALTTGSAGRDMMVISEDFSQTKIVTAPPGMTGGSCLSLTQDEQHLYAACTTGQGTDALMTVIDPENPTGYVSWATYTSPVVCIPNDVTLRQWSNMKFRSSGEGYVSVQVHTGPTVSDVQANPWLGPEGKEDRSFDDDTMWHDIAFLGGSRCLEARVVFHGFTTCPLTLDHLLFTYE